MKRIITILLSIIISISAILLPLQVQAAIYEPDVKLYSEAYLLISLDDENHHIVAQKNADKKMYPASLTKIVTAMVVLENVQDLQQKATVSQNAHDTLLGTGAQVAGLKVGDSLTIEQLLYLTMVHSACDATEVLAEFTGGSRERFVEMMNEYISSIDCKNSHFTNPDGLHDENNYTTASDMATITLEALKNPTFNKIAKTVEYKYNNTKYYHTNLMLRSGYKSYYYKYASGIKTGSTTQAGYCVVSTASKDGYNYLAVVMGAPHIDYNNDGYIEKCSFIDAASLFEWAFDGLKYATLVEKNEIIDEIAVENGKAADTVRLAAKEDITTIVPASLDKSTLIIELEGKPEKLTAPVKQGDSVCMANIISDGNVIAQAELVSADTVELSTFLTLINSIKAFFSLTIVKIVLALIFLFIVLLVLMFIRNYKKKQARIAARRRDYNNDEPLPPPSPRRY